MTNLGHLYTVQGKNREAEAMLSWAVATPRKVQPPGFFGTGFTLQALGDALVGLERYPEAEAALLEAHARCASGCSSPRRRAGPGNPSADPRARVAQKGVRIAFRDAAAGCTTRIAPHVRRALVPDRPRRGRIHE